MSSFDDSKNMTRSLNITEVIFFQGTDGTLDSSEDDSSEENDCGILAHLGELCCEYGALDTLATTVKIVETCVD